MKKVVIAIGVVLLAQSPNSFGPTGGTPVPCSIVPNGCSQPAIALPSFGPGGGVPVPCSIVPNGCSQPAIV